MREGPEVGKGVVARVSEHRSKLRAQGMKPVQMWLPNTGDQAVRQELYDMSVELDHYPGAEDDRAFIYALAEDE
jgi:dethiobiotin synthetase